MRLTKLKNPILIIKVNVPKSDKVKKNNNSNQNFLGKAVCNFNKIQCYNYNKKSHY